MTVIIVSLSISECVQNRTQHSQFIFANKGISEKLLDFWIFLQQLDVTKVKRINY